MLGLRRCGTTVGLCAMMALLPACADPGEGSADGAFDVRADAAVSGDGAVGDVNGGLDASADVALVVDIVPLDGGSAYDTGMPAADAGVGPCASLEEAYAVAVHGAEVCTLDGDCSTLTCETLCCACQVYVNPASPEFTSLGSLRMAWASSGCAAHQVCTAMACAVPQGAACSSVHRCSTFPR